MADKQALHVKVRNTDSIVFEGDVDRISSFNEVGPFDVYRMHANFISILRQQVVLYKDKQKVKELKFEQAVMKVKKDQVKIYLGIEVLKIEEEKTYSELSTKQGS